MSPKFQDNSSESLEFKTACPEGFLTGQHRPTLCLGSGLVVGAGLILLSWAVGYLPHGRLLNDPLMIALAFSTLIRGWLYFNWSAFLTALSVSVLSGILAWLALLLVTNKRNLDFIPEEARKTAMVTVGFSVIPVWIQEVDALPVFLWYGIATFLSATLAGMIAHLLHRLWLRFVK